MKKRISVEEMIETQQLQEVNPLPSQPKVKRSLVSNSKAAKSKDFLDKLREQRPEGEITRLTVDLDANTYNQLEKLCDFTGTTKASMIRQLIKEAVKLLDKKQ